MRRLLRDFSLVIAIVAGIIGSSALLDTALATTLSVSKTWSDGEIVFASDLNGNFTNITSWANGNISDTNISSSDKVDPTKIDDLADPNATSDPNTAATSLSEEVQKLRFQMDLVIEALSNDTTRNWHEPFTQALVPSGALLLINDPNVGCPTGYTETQDFAGIGFRGYDPNNSTTNVDDPNGIPDTVGVNCDADTLGSGCGGSGIDPNNYDDVPAVQELAGHQHQITDQTGGAGTFTADNITRDYDITSGDFFPTTSTGSSEPHYHPFRTVRVCQKD